MKNKNIQSSLVSSATDLYSKKNLLFKRGNVIEMSSNSEVHAYAHILKELKEKKGWAKNKIYTQQECQDNPEIKKYLGQTKPENVVEINEKLFYVIEAKNERGKIEQALKEAREDYANKINKSDRIKCVFITGIAGNERDGYIAKSQYLKNNKWETITENEVEITGLLSKQQAETILSVNNSSIQDVEISEEEFLKTAENINEILHENAIDKGYRARFISAILLSMSDGKDIDVTQETTLLISTINTKVDLILRKHGKQDFSRFIKIDEPSSVDNHIKVKEAIVKTYEALLGLNIRSAMRSGKDILGKFYEVFLKYGNGAKEIGIVLTPRHITRFSSEILDVNKDDLVLDVACGTGGFLVSALDEVRRKTKNKEEFEKFRLDGIYGIEEQDPVIALALVNMIFRGDGKTHMIEGNCFKKWLTAKTTNNKIYAEYLNEDKENREPPITKVLMNPPFAKPKSEDKEYKFIEHALKQMQDEGLLFSVLPTSNMVKQGGYLKWRKNSLLRENTLLCVINFPNDLFYPTGIETCGVIIKKGVPHQRNQNVLWIKIKQDGFMKSKGKRLPSSRVRNEFEDVKEVIKKFLKNQNIEIESIDEFQKACPIDFNDSNLELLPEVYLDEKKPTDNELKERVDKTIREMIALIVRNDKIQDFKKEVIAKNKTLFSKSGKINKPTLKEIPITDLFETPIKTGDYHVSGVLDEGDIPLVSCVSENGGFEGFFNIDNQDTIYKNLITIASDGMPLTSFYHFYPITAKDNVLLCKPNRNYRATTMLFITTQLNSLRWRFSYGRKCYENKAHKIKIYLPFKNGDIDEDYIENLFKENESWELLRKLTT
ncbi:MAG: N-6 DNA methylase [Candidatus Pacearchaeota archaeon]